MDIEKIKEIAIELLKRYNLELYSIRTKREFNMSILEVLVDGDEVDANSLGKINEALNNEIDEYLPNSYYLEVSTAGAIRTLRTIEEVKRQIGKYVLVKKDNQSVKGLLEKVVGDIMFIKVNEKGIVKVVEKSFLEADEVQLTVKF